MDISLTWIVLVWLALGVSGLSEAQPHPRPDFERKEWQALNGSWAFGFDPNNVGLSENWRDGNPAHFPLLIRVPFGWESELSGIHRPQQKGVAWYQRSFRVPRGWQGKRVWLCFGAVDYHSTVWINGEKAGEHTGGYSEFRLDITPHLKANQENRLTLRAEDHTDTKTPIGKQIPAWYTSTSGIWQTVWLETTGEARVDTFRIIPKANQLHEPTGVVEFQIEVEAGKENAPLQVEIRSLKQEFSPVSATVSPGKAASLTVQPPNPKFWSPNTPHLYECEIRLSSQQEGKTVLHDRVSTYFGIRTFAWGPYNGSKHTYVLLNGKPIYLCGALDQSFNPAGVYTAPDDNYLKRDIELAKAAGFNMLRIHIKADEPRRLYWADKLGMLIQADIPCHHAPVPEARAPFEQTMREQIARDFNHPSIYCWTVFNEEWGIGQIDRVPREHRVDWVIQMYQLAKQLDPTRIIQDNTGWSHLITEQNSFHWYSRDLDGFRTHYQRINRELEPGSGWNYIDQRKSQGEPFVNNEFGHVSAGNGDGDMSWGNLFAVNIMRSCDKMVGYTYTELSDIEWEHNGVYNYDRSPKEFGFDFWAPGMSQPMMFAEDFLVLDTPILKRARPGETVHAPALFSHYSGNHGSGLKLQWQLRSLDRFGKWIESRVETRDCPNTPPYSLTSLGALEATIPVDARFATLVAILRDSRGKVVHINYTQWRVEGETPLPTFETLAAGRFALWFNPNRYVQSRFSEQSNPDRLIPGKHYGRGSGFVEYEISLPEAIDPAKIKSLTLLCEVASKAGREKVDWAQRIHPEDYPQTDGKKHPSEVKVWVNGVEAARWVLADDPADARGVLSHWAGIERGSYGELKTATLTTRATKSKPAFEKLSAERKVILRFEVPANAKHPGGFTLYGEQMGCYPVEPTLLIEY